MDFQTSFREHIKSKTLETTALGGWRRGDWICLDGLGFTEEVMCELDLDRWGKVSARQRRALGSCQPEEVDG